MKDFFLTVTEDGMMDLPPEICDYCGASAILAVGKDNGIALYPAEQWRRLSERMNDTPAFAKAFRILISSSVEVDISGGVLQLPPHLLQYSGIRSKARVLLSADSCLIVKPHND